MPHFLLTVNSKFAYFTPQIRAICLGVLLLAELFITSASFDAQPLSRLHLPVFALIANAAYFLRISITIVVAFFLLNLPRLNTVFLPFTIQKNHPQSLAWLSVHCLLIACFWLFSFLLYQSTFVHQSANAILVSLIATLWFLIGSSSLICLLLALSPFAVWVQFFRLEKVYFALAVFVGGISWGISVLVSQSWSVLASLTFRLAEWLLSLFYKTVVSDLDTKVLGTVDFQVRIAPQCSGYQGIVLVIVFLSLYLWAARRQLRFPHALLLYPIVIVFIWLFNVLRISLLIIVGSVWSPEIAVGGFHSNAGWIAFVLVSTGIVLLAQRLSIFNKQPISATNEVFQENIAAPLLVPFIVLMASILITGAFISDFDWLYPIRVLASLIALWFFRAYYKTVFRDLTGRSLLIGVMVFLIWIMLVPVSEEKDLAFMASLGMVSKPMQSGWLFFRFIGAALTIPIIEELVFRGYLIAKLIDRDFQYVKPGQFTLVSFSVSSLLFGALHGDWVAGTLAGMSYALALYHRGAVSDSIAAHATTNVLLAFYVMATRHWSLW